MKKRLTKNLLNKVKNYLENNSLIIIGWILTVTLTTLITFVSGFNILFQTYQNTIGYKNRAYTRIKALKPNINILNYYDILGKPSIIRALSLEEKSGEIKQYVFYDKYYYISALTDNLGGVLSLIITSRIKDFQPEFIQNTKVIKLNKTTFSEIAESPESCFVMTGVTVPMKYFEGSYGSHAANYQAYYIGVNGYGYNINNDIKEFNDYRDAMIFEGTIPYPHFGKCEKMPVSFRSKSKINTIILNAPNKFQPDSLIESFNEFQFGINEQDAFSLNIENSL